MPPELSSEHNTGFIVVDKSEIADITPEERLEEYTKIKDQLKLQIQVGQISHDSSMGEWMYLTVCPLHGPGHDSSVEEWM